MAKLNATGREQDTGIKKGVVWGTPVVIGAGDGVRVLPDSISPTRENSKDDSLGMAFSLSADPDVKNVAGDLPAWLRYDSLTLPIAMAMGATGGAPAQQAATAAYQQTFDLVGDLNGLFVTMAINLNKMVKEFASVKITGFVIAGEVGKAITITFNVIAYDLVSDSVINTTITMANLTYPEDANRVLFSQAVFRKNVASAGALASPADVVQPSSFELTFERNMAGQFATGTSIDLIDEPTMEEVPTVSLKLVFPRLTGNTEFAAWEVGVGYKGDIIFTGAEIEAPYNNLLKIEMPNMVIQDVQAAAAQGAVTNEVMFDLIAAAAAPTGMVGVTEPFAITIINKETADVLA